jgi:uncharacterized LabA/DUF88 family protein
MSKKVAILIDGAFLNKKLQIRLKRFPEAEDIISHCSSLLKSASIKDYDLFRIYYYDVLPYEKRIENPINITIENIASKDYVRSRKQLIESLELKPHFAVRKGVIVNRGWKLRRNALKSICEGRKDLNPYDIIPDLRQKTVDLKIGLDIAWLSVKHIVDAILLITGDADFVPAMKFARKEGTKVYLNTLNHPVNRELKVHCDLKIEI